jgi:ornithine cyclodeaminase/alanine dehydrogenase-like protein (mu-crystallin family)
MPLVHDVERALVAAATGAPLALPDAPDLLPALGAVASRYLAVGTPRSIGLIGPPDRNAASLAAHRVWFDPREVRDGDDDLDAALAADIVCVHVPLAITARQLRRGTHVNALAAVALDPELVAVIIRDLAPIAAGFVDGRQLDELTIFLAVR